MTNIIMVEAVMILILGFVIYFLNNSLKQEREENEELKKENERLKNVIWEYTEIRKETIENQKKYRSNDDVTNFNNSIDFLQNNRKNNGKSNNDVSNVSMRIR